jgi:glycerol kinase
MRIAAIDQGTTSTRLLIADADGRAEIRHAVRHRQSHPRPGWVEHDARELLANVRACIAAAGAVDAIGIDNQGESCLAWDALSGEPLSPVIVWQDNRTAGELARLEAAGAGALSLERAGLPLDAYFSGSKLGWIVREMPAARAALDAGRLRLGTTDAFFLDRLAGVFATDVTTASRTALMNLEDACWDDELCRLFGVPIGCLPEIRPTIGGFGAIGGIGAKGGVPIAAAVVDQQAALYGHGCRAPGDAKITFGTGAFALALTGARIVRAPERGLLPTIAWAEGAQRVHAVEGGVYDAGAAVAWGMRVGLIDDVAQLDAFDPAPAIDRGLAFVPALSGLACPHWDRSAGAVFIGMDARTTREDLRQALVEGIVLRAAEVIEAMAAEVPIGTVISIDGGLSRSRYAAQFLADCLGRRVSTSSFDELTAFGTASLAARALGVELKRPADGVALFEPRDFSRAERRERFADAVRRSRAWR